MTQPVDPGTVRFNPPPGWPSFGTSLPPQNWQPDTSWPRPPARWLFYFGGDGSAVPVPHGAWVPRPPTPMSASAPTPPAEFQLYPGSPKQPSAPPVASTPSGHSARSAPSAPEPRSEKIWASETLTGAADDAIPGAVAAAIPVPIQAQPARAPGVPGARLRYGIIVGAGVLALALLAGFVVFQVAAWRANHLPDSFVAAKLLPASQHYARDVADGDPLAKSYPGKPEDYRTWLETNWDSREREGEAWPVQPTKALSGRYDRPGTPMSVALTRYSIDSKIWDSYVQQRLLNVLVGESRIALGSDVFCRPAETEGDSYGTSCVKIVRDGFWYGYAYLAGEGGGGGVPVRNAEMARDMAELG